MVLILAPSRAPLPPAPPALMNGAGSCGPGPGGAGGPGGSAGRERRRRRGRAGRSQLLGARPRWRVRRQRHRRARHVRRRLARAARRSGSPVSAAGRSGSAATSRHRAAPGNRRGRRRTGPVRSKPAHGNGFPGRGSSSGGGVYEHGDPGGTAGPGMIRGALQHRRRRRRCAVGEPGAVGVGEPERRQPGAAPEVLRVDAPLLERRVHPRLQDPVRQQIRQRSTLKYGPDATASLSDAVNLLTMHEHFGQVVLAA